MATYVQPEGNVDGTDYYQDVAITKTTLYSGALKQRLDTRRYPQRGIDNLASVSRVVPSVAVTASNDAPVHAVSDTLTATVSHPLVYFPAATGVVTFKDGVTTLGTDTLSAGVANLVVSAGFTAGAHSITAVFPGDGVYATATSPAHVVTAT